jgi:heme a synthase
MLGLATLFLVALGGVVTTKGVGMAVPDWPTTYGENMFLFPYSKWVGGVFYEHSHRLAASVVGMLTTILAGWLWCKESRRWLRYLGVIAFFGVVFQGVLGGLRVIFNQHGWGTELGILHATVAQLFFLLVCSIALFTSEWWNRRPAGDTRANDESVHHVGQSRRPELDCATALGMRRIFIVTTFLILLQLVLGATMRHQHAGLAVPDFPLAYGKLWPATDAASVELYNAQRLEAAGESPITAPHVVIHMLHRFTGFAVLLAIAGCAVMAWRKTIAGSLLRKFAALWFAIVLVQATLGILTILSQRKVDVTTAHVAVGALTLMIGWTLALMASRDVAVRTTVLPAAGTILPQAPEFGHA